MSKQFTRSEVEKAELYIVGDEVFDLSKFVKSHPGGETALEEVKGTDITRQFKMLHKDSVLKGLAQKFKVGTLAPSQIVKPPKNEVDLKLVASTTPSRYSGGTAGLLPAERNRASFDVNKMSEVLYGGKEGVAKRKFILHPTMTINNGYKKYDMTREQLIEHGITDFVKIHRPFTMEGYRPENDEVSWMSEAATNTNGMMPHYGLFLPTILGQGSDAQIAAWLPRALTFQMVGSYAQTELSHGSNVRGLQTTATWDQAKKKFIINTPTLGATKWWNSNAGIVATHCALYAQLIIDKKEYGVHVFMVQLRDENHNFVKGVFAGDVGAKLGDNGIDTSFIQFDNVEIPREHMFSKRQHVDVNGKYVKHGREEGAGGDKAHYLTMMSARAGMISIAAGKLSIAATIAARYSCVRQQGFVDSSANASFQSKENSVIEYQVQRYRVLKQVCLSYAMRASGTWIGIKMAALRASAFGSGGKLLDEMPEIHATCAGLKGLLTKLCADGIEDCRKCCGGHGYLLNSGVGQLSVDYVWQASAEGDFTVLLLQTGRFLLKSVHAARKGEQLSGLTDCFAPMKDPGYDPVRHAKPKPSKSSSEVRNLNHILELFKYRTLVSCDRVARMFDTQMSRPNTTFEQAFNACALPLLTTAQSHCFFFMVRNFLEVIKIQSDANIQRVLTNVAVLFALSEILDGKQWIGLLEAGEYLNVEKAIAEVLDELRPDVVALVDAFDWPDAVLNSTLGRYDGNCYEALFEAAVHAPLNTGKPFKGYEELRKSLDLEFLKLRNSVCPELAEDDQPPAAGASSARL